MALTARCPVVLPKLPTVPEGRSQGSGGAGSSSPPRRPLPVLTGTSAARGSRSARAPAACRQDVGPLSLPPATRRGLDAGGETEHPRLSQYFDDGGRPRFRSSGLYYAAKQSPQYGRTFGSRSEAMAPSPEDESARNKRSAQTFFLAAEARQRDFEGVQQRTLELLNSIKDAQRYQDEEVQRRQFEMLFDMVPDFSRHFPARVSRAEVLPVDIDAEEETRNRKEALHYLDCLTDPFWTRGKEMPWILHRSSVLLVWQVASLWMQAAWGFRQHLGIARSTFCRFVLDCGLVDQNKVPLFWAVSLFDDLARPMRLGGPHSGVRHLVPVQPLLGWWDLITVLDTILQQHFGGNPQPFVKSLFPIAKMQLPAFVIEESGLNENLVEQILAGTAPMTFFWRHEDEQPNLIVRPDKAAASPQEMQHLETMRERLVQSLLVEPEVLHMVLQYQGFFQKLHSCYSDEQGDMDFAMLLQFCVDFQLTPALVPSSIVLRAFESSHCVTLRPSAPDAPSQGRSRRPILARSQTQVARRSKLAALKEDPCRPSKPGNSGSPHSASRPPSSSSVSTSASTAATSAPSATRSPPRRRASVMVASVDDTVHSDLPWRQVARAAEQELESSRTCPMVFGVGAFAEALCFIVFTYLGSYGNMQQRGMGGFTRMVWMMTYLSSVIAHLHRGLEKRANAGNAPLPHGRLQAALQCFPRGEDPWAGTPFPSGMALSPTVFRLSLKPEGPPKRKRTKNGVALPAVARNSAAVHGASDWGGSQLASGKVSWGEWYLSKDYAGEHPPPAAGKHEQAQPGSEGTKKPAVLVTTSPTGSPCVVHGVCRVCGRGAPSDDWGSARCHGCSVVDMLSFKEHLFKPLLLGWLGQPRPSRPVGRWPSKVPRSVLTPPSLGRSDELRRGPAPSASCVS